jgi:hypothetical protein
MESIRYQLAHSLLCFCLLIKHMKFKIYVKQIYTFEINMQYAHH